MRTRFFFAALMAAATMSATAMTNDNESNSETNAAPAVETTVKSTPVTHVFFYDNTKVEYNLDEEGRVASKVRYTMNADGKWTPTTAYSVFYGDKVTTLSCAKWNEKKHTFTSHPQQVKYSAERYPEVLIMPMPRR